LPENGKKSGGAKIAKKIFRGRYAKQDIFLALPVNFEIENIVIHKILFLRILTLLWNEHISSKMTKRNKNTSILGSFLNIYEHE